MTVCIQPIKSTMTPSLETVHTHKVPMTDNSLTIKMKTTDPSTQPGYTKSTVQSYGAGKGAGFYWERRKFHWTVDPQFLTFNYKT